ncbi:MAG: tRNA (adenosine(37)-N6)-dimethylallyltransferase MiaA [Patescibacteria group bacterium]|jgi:tRNA dimethylallyltransferase
MKPKIIIIVGPTASGKSGLAEAIAEKFNGEILCVDSRTVYRGMDIGTAKDSGDLVGDVKALRLHGLDLVGPNQEMNGALFKDYADKTITEILSRGHLPILVGGTGLWMDMIVDNLEMPEVEPDLTLRAELEKQSEEDLFAEFEKLDPVGAEVIDRHNKRRLVRALEVCKKTGRPFSELRKKGEGKYDALWLGLDVPKEVLDERINVRVDEMIKQGLLKEVKQLKEKYGCEVYAMSGIGYQEICRHLNGEISLAEAIEEIKKNTRQYAKRQRTWFKRNKNIRSITDVSETELIVQAFL